MTQPLPADVTVTAAALGAVPTAEITIDGIEARHVVLYLHGGVYVLGSNAESRSWRLLARIHRADWSGRRVVTDGCPSR
jgi:acetyl esterase/lipase